LAPLRGLRKLLVCPHDDPDPDALAAAWSISLLLSEHLGTETTVAFAGIIGRAENRAMVRELRIPLRRLEALDMGNYEAAVLADTQPGAGNHSLLGKLPIVGCVDHHDIVPGAPDLAWRDLRPDGGATSAIVLEYLVALGIEITPALATAILYALKTDTRDFTRDATALDLWAFGEVFPLADGRAMGAILHPRLDGAYFQQLHQALLRAELRGTAVLVFLPTLSYPDLVAELADFFVRRRHVRWALCAGTYRSELRFSLRSEDRHARAGKIARQLVGPLSGSAGGHGMVAGGRAPLDEGRAQAERAWQALSQAFLTQIRVHDEPEPLC